MLRKILHPNYHLGMTKMAFRRLLFHQKSNYMKVGFELQFYYVCLCMSVIAWKIIKHNNPISRNPKNSSNIYAVRNFLDNFIFVASLFLEILLIRLNIFVFGWWSFPSSHPNLYLWFMDDLCFWIGYVGGCVDSRLSNVALSKFDLTLLSTTEQTAAAAAA